MSEISVNPFLFSRRANTINLNLQELPDFNDKIKQISDLRGVQFNNFKDLFVFLLDLAISSDSIEEISEHEMVIEKNTYNLLEQTIDALTSQVAALTEEKEQLSKDKENIETASFERELSYSQALENHLLVQVEPEHKELLEGIAQNRLEAGYTTEKEGEPDSAASIMRQITFQSHNIYNDYKRFYTGIK